MKRVLLIFLVLIILASGISYYRNNDPKIILSELIKKGDFVPGELRYQINLFGIIPVGEAVFEAEKIEEYNGQKYYHLNASAQSFKGLSRFFSAHAALESFVDMQQLSPVVFRQKVEISGKQPTLTEIAYDQKNNVMSIGGVKRQILPNTQEPLSVMLNFKRMNFDNIKIFEMNINCYKKNYLLKGAATQEDILINRKLHKVILVEAKVRRSDKNNPYHQSQISMVLLKEKENIPIVIRVFASGFLINVKLIDIK